MDKVRCIPADAEESDGSIGPSLDLLVQVRRLRRAGIVPEQLDLCPGHGNAGSAKQPEYKVCGVGFIGQFQGQLRFCLARPNQKPATGFCYPARQLRPAQCAAVAGSASGFHQFIERSGFYLERQLAACAGLPLGKGQAPLAVVPLIQRKGHAGEGFPGLAVGLDDGDRGLPGGCAAASSATAADGGGVVLAAAQQNVSAVKTDAVAVAARLPLDDIRRIDQHIGAPVPGPDGKLHGKAVCTRVKAGGAQSLTVPGLCVTGPLIFAGRVSRQLRRIEPQRVGVQLKPFVQRIHKRGIFREGQVVRVDQHFIGDQLVFTVYRAALDQSMVGEALLYAVGNFRERYAIRRAVHTDGIFHHYRHVAAKPQHLRVNAGLEGNRRFFRNRAQIDGQLLPGCGRGRTRDFWGSGERAVHVGQAIGQIVSQNYVLHGQPRRVHLYRPSHHARFIIVNRRILLQDCGADGCRAAGTGVAPSI